jgi:hypothetical protein
MEPIDKNAEFRQKALEPLIEEVKETNRLLVSIDQRLSHLEDWAAQMDKDGY